MNEKERSIRFQDTDEEKMDMGTQIDILTLSRLTEMEV